MKSSKLTESHFIASIMGQHCYLDGTIANGIGPIAARSSAVLEPAVAPAPAPHLVVPAGGG